MEGVWASLLPTAVITLLGVAVGAVLTWWTAVAQLRRQQRLDDAARDAAAMLHWERVRRELRDNRNVMERLRDQLLTGVVVRQPGWGLVRAKCSQLRTVAYDHFMQSGLDGRLVGAARRELWSAYDLIAHLAALVQETEAAYDFYDAEVAPNPYPQHLRQLAIAAHRGIEGAVQRLWDLSSPLDRDLVRPTGAPNRRRVTASKSPSAPAG